MTYAGVSYLDRTRPLEDGSAAPEGFSLHFEGCSDIPELFRIAAQEARFEATEMSMSTLILMVSRGDDRLVALPVFPSRAFRQRDIFVHSESGITSPEQLRGRRVGVFHYQMSAALWNRAMLQHEYGILPSEIHWWTGGLSKSAWQERLEHSTPPGVVIDRIPADRSLEELLERGEIDALLSVRPPRSFVPDAPSPVRRLFPDFRAVEEAYFRKTRFFPIMHTVAVRRDFYDAHPGVVLALTQAFEDSKRMARARLLDTGTLAVMHPWIGAEISALDALGGGDMFAYGFAANRHVIEAMTQYSFEQGLANRKVEPEELFAAETLDWVAKAT